MRCHPAAASLLALTVALGCALDASSVPPRTPGIDPPAPDRDASAATPPTVTTRVSASWPDDARFVETAAALPRPYTLATVRTPQGQEMLALAHRAEGGWLLDAVYGAPADLRGEALECESLPCPFPSALTPRAPLAEPPPLPEDVRDRIAYARTLIAFEGPLNVHDEAEADDGSWLEELPESTWSDPSSADLAPYLERLRRYHPMGYCSMDTRPQIAAQMRAVAAAQAGRTGWAVQGWMDTVGYFSSARMAWSSYGQSHPEDHARLLQMVGVDPQRFLLGVIFDLPGDARHLHLADVRRLVPEMGERFADALRALATDPRVDPYDRALLFASVADLPFEDDPQFEALPAESRQLLTIWSR